MSITFCPANNQDYCNANGWTRKTVYKCQCVDFPDLFSPASPCRECQGKGEVSFPNYPFEINLANGNAHALQTMLRMPDDYSGSCDPQVILDGIAFIKAMQASGFMPLVSETTQDGGPGTGQARAIYCGRSPEQVEHYLAEFETIAMEAARRKVEIVWG